MIMPRGQPLLLPASPAFIWGSLLVALMLNLLPLGRVLWMPDFLAVVLVFWNIHQPRKVGIGIAFLVSFGLLLPSLAVAARRLSDAGLSPWLLLLMLVPFGSIALVVMFLLPTAAPRPSVGLA